MAKAKRDADDIGTLIRDIATLVVGYVKQETIEPVRGLGRFLAFGAAGVVVGGLGLFLLVLGGIRLLQEETGSAFRGHLSFVPYVIALVACAAVAGLAVRAGTRTPDGREDNR